MLFISYCVGGREGKAGTPGVLGTHSAYQWRGSKTDLEGDTYEGWFFPGQIIRHYPMRPDGLRLQHVDEAPCSS